MSKISKHRGTHLPLYELYYHLFLFKSNWFLISQVSSNWEGQPVAQKFKVLHTQLSIESQLQRWPDGRQTIMYQLSLTGITLKELCKELQYLMFNL